MRKLVMLTVAVVFAFALLTGCNMEQLDEDAIRELVLSSEWFEGGAPEDTARDDPEAVLFTADTIYWWRASFTNDDPEVTIDPIGDSAYVEWKRHHTGHMNIFAFEPDTGWMHWDKEYGETAEVRGTFHRTGSASDSARGWVLETISCAVGYSDNGTITIDSIRLVGQNSGNDVFLTPPYTDYFYEIDDLPAFNSLEPVTITIYSTSSVETEAYLHTIVGLWPVRAPFTAMGDGVHEQTWTAQWWPANRFIILDVVTKGTLWEMEDPYDYSGVLFPYQTVTP